MYSRSIQSKSNPGSTTFMLLVIGFSFAGGNVRAQSLADRIRDHYPFQNLRVLDPNITPEELAPIMVEVSRAIGSESGCLHCHAGASGTPLSSWSFASDEKTTKRVARQMMRMVLAMNSDYLSDLPGRDTAVAVSCRTCHNSRPRPIPLEAVVYEAVRDSGIDNAVDLYRALRERYFGADAYDFNEYSLRRVEQQLPDSAVDERDAILRLNLEFHPDSWRTWLQLGELYLSDNQPELAILYFQQSLLVRPSSAAVEGLRSASRLLDTPDE